MGGGAVVRSGQNTEKLPLIQLIMTMTSKNNYYVCTAILNTFTKLIHLIYIEGIIVKLLHFGEGNGTPLQYSCLENPMNRRAWWAAVHGVAKSQTWLSDFPFTFHFHALEKEMAAHSSVLAWRIPGPGEPGGLPSMGSHRVRYDWSNLAAATGLLHFID